MVRFVGLFVELRFWMVRAAFRPYGREALLCARRKISPFALKSIALGRAICLHFVNEMVVADGRVAYSGMRG